MNVDPEGYHRQANLFCLACSFEQRVRSLIFFIYELFCFAMVKAIARSVGHPDLSITYKNVLGSDTGNSKAIQMIDLSIRLDNLSFPENEIMAALKAFRGNILCQSLLRRLVVY